ncbi:unnamed protein product [Mytilus edulis]|uniref:EGF-like domain-containing protein n=1 Tax=Mytilus edulis TaxID=6550 RepID=A0A8S3TXN1_MYTED|nr:unnamed protein product [Mytilus edulis]
MESTFSLFLFVINTGLLNGACPSKCTCSYYQSGTYVNCESQSLEYIPTDFLRDTVSLYLGNNRLQSIQSYTFINMSQLYYLNLNRNNISHIEEHAFGKLPSLLDLYMTYNPFNCDCSVFSLWSWLTERLSIPFMGIGADCSNGTSIISLQSDALEICNPDNCKCFNGGECMAIGSALVCDCIGQWTGEFCQESQCTSYDCGYGDCYIEPENGTAQCLCGDRYVNYCPVYGMKNRKCIDICKTVTTMQSVMKNK